MVAGRIDIGSGGRSKDPSLTLPPSPYATLNQSMPLPPMLPLSLPPTPTPQTDDPSPGLDDKSPLRVEGAESIEDPLFGS